MPLIHRSAALAAVAGAIALAACSTEPDNPCQQLVGTTQVVVDSVQSVGLQIAVTDSVRLGASVRLVVSARPDALIGGGTVCAATFGQPLASPVSAESSDTSVVAVRNGTWLVAKTLGNVNVAVTAAAPAEPTFVNVTVTP